MKRSLRSALTFYAGVLKKDGKYIMIFRNDVGDYDEQKLAGDELKNFLDKFYGALGE